MANLVRSLLCAVTGDGEICGVDNNKRQAQLQEEAAAIVKDKDRFRKVLEKPATDLNAAEMESILISAKRLDQFKSAVAETGAKTIKPHRE